jgi:enoyl-CoA hydratase/carnithine racemase
MGACAMLPRMIGQGRATELLATGRAMGGEEARALGLLQPPVRAGRPVRRGTEAGPGSGDGPTFAHGMTKKMLQQEWNMGVDEAIEAEAQAQAICMADQRLPSRLSRLRRQAEARVRRAIEMRTYPPAPFPWKGVTLVQPRRGFHAADCTPPWGGPAEA